MLDGAGRSENYVKAAAEFHHPAITILDHGNMSGTFDFYQKVKAKGIKPIIGMEAYINDNMDKTEEKKYEGSDTHQSILIKNMDGYKSLNKLTYLSFTEGYYRRGRITTEWLIENKKGLFLTTSCCASMMARMIEEDKFTEAEERLKLLMREFGDDLVAELQFNEYPGQKKYNLWILKMVKKYSLMPILTGDVHYALPDDNRLQDTLIAINQGQRVDDPKTFKLTTRQLYYTSFDDFHRMNKEFGFNYPEEYVDMCLENTLKVAEKLNFNFETDVEKYPEYQPTADVSGYFKTQNALEIITKLSHAKLTQKLNKYRKNAHIKGIPQVTEAVEKEYRDRLDYEIGVIQQKKMIDYFLVVWELIRYCNENDIATGPGRGSAAGCLLSWCLGITKLDPIRFGLYFERFLNPTRKGPPDIDIDFESGTDDRTMQFLFDKYGKDRVVPVITFGTFNEKGCLKDVAKALGQDAGFQSDVFAVTKEMPAPTKWEITLEEWFRTWPENPKCSERVREWLRSPDNKEILNLTLKMQGQVRNLGKHAAGIVITPSPIWEHMPVNICKGVIVSGFQESGSGKDLSTLGYLKLDRLKLITLNIVKQALHLIKVNRGVDISERVLDIDLFDIYDPNLYLELRMCNNQGVFQFESAGMGALIKGMKLESFDELVAANSLYRPGPMGIGAHEEFIKNKFNPTSRTYAHPILTPLLEATNGVLIYQEQLMFIAEQVGGMTRGEGDNLRKFMDSAGKIIAKALTGEKLEESEETNKNYKGYKELWNKFLEGAKAKGLGEKDVTAIEEWLIKYLGYSFNKSHAACYSMVALQTLYLKHYYPTEFYCALLNHAKGSGDKEQEKQWLTSVMLAAMSKGIEITPPERRSGWEWTVIEDRKVAMGFSSINGMGEVAFQELQAKGLAEMAKDDFFNAEFKKFNKGSFEACLKAGLFDDWSKSREEIIEWRSIKIKNIAQLDLWGNHGFSSVQITKKFPETPDEQKHRDFIEVCNLDLKLLKRIADLRKEFMDEYGIIIEPVTNFDDRENYYYFCLNHIEIRESKRGTQFYSLIISDGATTKKITMWNDVYKRHAKILEPGGFYVTKFMMDKGWLAFDGSAQFRRVF